MMTLRNMRENGVRSLAITCGALWCHHEAILDVGAYADDLTVPSINRQSQIAANLAGGVALSLDEPRLHGAFPPEEIAFWRSQ